MKLCISLGVVVLAVVATELPARDRDRDRSRYQFDIPQTPQRNPQADQARAEADQAYQRGDYKKVIELADRLLSFYSTDNPHVAYHLRASAKIELGRQSRSTAQIREGIADAREALALAGTRFRWLYLPYLFGVTSLAEIENRPAHADLAISVVGPLLALPTGEGYSPEDKGNLYYQRALAYFAKKDLLAATADLSETIKLNPQQMAAHIKRAEAYAQLGQTREAKAAFDELVRQFPNAVLAHNSRGAFRRSAGDLEGALADFTRALQIDSKFAVGYINRGACLGDQNNPQAAEGDFNAALKLPLDAGTQLLAYHMRAQSRVSQGNADGALADYSAALKLSPQHAGLYEERGFAYFYKRDFARAVADFKRVLQLDPTVARVLPWQALALARAGNTAESTARLVQVADMKPVPNPWVARLCDYLGNRITADDLLAAATEFGDGGKDARICEARYFIGQKHLLASESAAANDQFREAIATKSFLLAAYRGSRFELGDFETK